MTEKPIDPKVYDLYDEYCHTQMTRRDFFNNSTPRYDEKQANIAWERAMAFFKKHL